MRRPVRLWWINFIELASRMNFLTQKVTLLFWKVKTNFIIEVLSPHRRTCQDCDESISLSWWVEWKFLLKKLHYYFEKSKLILSLKYHHLIGELVKINHFWKWYLLEFVKTITNHRGYIMTFAVLPKSKNPTPHNNLQSIY